MILNQQKKTFVVKTTSIAASMSVFAAMGAATVTDDDIISFKTALASVGVLLMYGVMSCLWFKPIFLAMDKFSDL